MNKSGMTFEQAILHASIWIALAVLAVAFLLTVWRVVKGPTLPDRVVALDMLVGIVIGFIALIAIRTGFTLYIDIAIALGLVGFLATVAFARFILAGAVGQAGATLKEGPGEKVSKLGGKARKVTTKKIASSDSKPAAKPSGKAVRPITPEKSAPSAKSPRPGKGK